MPKKKAKTKLPPNRDPEHMRLIGSRGGKKTARRGKKFFSKIAKKSHPKNNPDANRPEYRGGRKPKCGCPCHSGGDVKHLPGACGCELPTAA